jgi:hypothetical protein
MTSFEFRQLPERVGAWRKLLSENPLVADAIVCLKDEKPSATVPPGSDALDRAAALAKLEQHDADVNLLLSLAEPLPPELPPEEELWGVDREKFLATK